MSAYARSTMSNYQDDPPGATFPASGEMLEAARLALERRERADTLAGAVRAGLLRWLLVLAALGALSLAFGHPDAALFLAVAGMFALAGSWDTRDRARTGDPASDAALAPGGLGTVLRALVPVLVPAAGALLYAGLGTFARTLGRSGAHLAASQWCSAAAAVCVLMAFPPVVRLVSGGLMPREEPGHTARLTASLAVVLLLLPVPARLLIGDLMGVVAGSGKPLVDVSGLAVQLAGEVLFALAAVRLWVGRDFAAVRERLGLGRIGVRESLIAACGLVAIMGVNAGMEWLEHARFPALWQADQDMGKLIAGDLGIATAIVLGVSAGVGEEVLVRGALQPRVGLLWASLLFACGHVQYTWFGMLTIAMLGVTLGLIRSRANTTTAIVVHALYDILAALGTK